MIAILSRAVSARSVPVAALLLLAAAWLPASAQRGAPITRGATSSDIAATTQALLEQNADLQLEVQGLREENARLLGEVETLQFLLGQTRDEVNRMQGDDAEIGRQLSAIQQKLKAQDAKIASLERQARAPSAMSGGSVRYSDGSTELRSGADTLGDTVDAVTGGAAAGDEAAGDTRVTRIIRTAPEGEPEAATPGEARVTRTVRPNDTGSAGGNPPQTGSLGTIPASALPGEAGPLFEDAKTKLLQFDYAGAEQSFRAFLEQFGDDPQAAEAHYWLGEVLYQQEAYADSGAAYTEMIRTYPDDARAPDALVKLARSLRLVGETDKACAALDTLPRRYPNASGVTRNLAAVERTRSGCGS